MDDKITTVSVIIPCFNSQKTISRALNSVCLQTYKEYEVVIVDDGSTDNTKEIIQTFFKDKKITYNYIYQVNAGPSSARNNGVKSANGKYIAFLDSDDEWHYKKLEIQMKIMKENNLNFLGSTYTYDDLKYEKLDKIELKKYIFKKLILSNKFSTPGVIIKKILFEQLGGFDTSMKYSEDYDLWLRASLKEDLYMIKEPKLIRLYKNAYGASGLSGHIFKMFKGELYILKKLLKNNSLHSIIYFFINIFITIKFIRRLIINYFKA